MRSGDLDRPRLAPSSLVTRFAPLVGPRAERVTGGDDAERVAERQMGRRGPTVVLQRPEAQVGPARTVPRSAPDAAGPALGHHGVPERRRPSPHLAARAL